MSVYNPFGFLSNHNTATATAPAAPGSGAQSNVANGAGSNGSGQQSQAPAAIPFYKAAKFHHEIGQTYTGTTLAGGQTFKPPVPAYGWMRRVDLRVNASGGVDSGETVAFNADAPWNTISNLILKNPSGRQLVSCTGFQAYEVQRYSAIGLFAIQNDTNSYGTTLGASASGNYFFLLPIWQEFGQYGRGCLPNTNQSATYKLEVTFGSSTDVYSVPPDTLPTLDGYIGLMARLAPAPTDLYGRSQMQSPPLAGIYQEVSVQTKAVVNGHNTFFSERVGNVIRYLIMIWRASDGTRHTAVTGGTYPAASSHIRITWDTTVLYDTTPVELNQLAFLQTGLVSDEAVIPILFTGDEDQLATGEDGGQYLPTLGSTKLEIEWDSTTSGGSFELITVDIVSPDGGVGVTQ